MIQEGTLTPWKVSCLHAHTSIELQIDNGAMLFSRMASEAPDYQQQAPMCALLQSVLGREHSRRGGIAVCELAAAQLCQVQHEGVLVVMQVFTHELPLTEAPHAYKIFNEKKEGCVKVVMHPWQ